MITWLGALLIALSPPPAAAEPVAVAARQEANGTHTLSHSIEVDAPAAEVWTAVSTAEGWRAWAVPVARMVAGEPGILETSYSPGSQAGDATTIRQRFVAQLPGRILVFTTVRAPQGFPHFETFSRVTSFIELEPLGERRTRMRLTGVGYADTEAGRQLLGFFREGNRVSLERLRQRFVSGPLDWARVLRQRTGE